MRIVILLQIVHSLLTHINNYKFLQKKNPANLTLKELFRY